jgi:hypothetical protein
VQFAKVALDPSGAPAANPTTTIFPGTSLIRRVIVDAEAERTHLIVGIYGSYAVTFDWRSERVSGTTAISQLTSAQNVSAGLDPVSGRYYLMVPPLEGSPPEPGGLLMVDGRRSPTPQALAFREALIRTEMDSPTIQPLSRPGDSSRYLVARPMTGTLEGADHFLVIRDPIPVSVDPPITAIDRTTDVEEREGVTDSTFAAEAGGYGTRVLVSGGALPAGSPVFKQLGACNSANRDISFGAAPVSSLSNLAASARVFAADADQGTRADSSDRSRCWPAGTPPKEVQGGSEWIDGRAECVGDVVTSTKDVPQRGASTTASCAFAESKVSGESIHPAVDTGVVTVARSRTTSAITRLADNGVESRTEAVAEGIKIPGVAEISVVRSEAVARSTGRPNVDKPRTDWTVTFCGVKTASGDYAQGGCRSGKELAPVIDALNRAAGGRFVFVQHRPDDALRAGSPGGYISGVQRNQAEVNLARLENNDGSFAVAALEIQRRNDSSLGVNRQVVQLAGVRSVTAYGISLLPTSEVRGDTSAPPSLFDDLAADLGVGPAPEVPDLGPETETLQLSETSAAPVVGSPGIVGQIGERLRDGVRVVRDGFRLLTRSPGEAALAVCVWMSLALPWALARRRVQLRGLA